jgi:cobalt-zinc-cadmium efflux system protein
MSGHSRQHRRPSEVPTRALGIALCLTATFMGVEAAAGWWSGSLALIADAGHMLADTGALTLALLAQHWAARVPGQRTTYGFRRAEVLAAFLNGIGLAVTALWVVREAAARWQHPIAIHGPGMLATATTGLIVNLTVALVLKRAQGTSINVRAAFFHVLADAFGSVGAIMAALAVVLLGAKRADPLLSVAIACLVAVSGWRILRETVAILLETVPAHLELSAIERTIRNCSGVAELHDLHVWRVSEGFDALTVHVTLASGAHGAEVCRRVAEALRVEHGLSHVTIQPEAPPPDQVVQLRCAGENCTRQSS